MRKALLIIGIFISINCKADPEPPAINGLLKIELKNGSTKIGFVTLAVPSFNYFDYQMSGIYYKIDKYQGIVNFDIDMIYFQVGKSSIVVAYKSKNWIYTPNVGVPEMKFVRCKYTYPQEKESFNLTENGMEYSKVEYQNYELLDYIPLSLFETNDKQEYIVENIQIKDISKIEIIKTPTEEYLSLIEKYKSDYEKKMNEKYSESGDGWNPPKWYHEIISNQDEYFKYLLRMKD